MGKFSYEVLFHPGNYFTKAQLDQLTSDLRSIASDCFDEIPYYQTLTGKRDEYKRAIISLARDKDKKIVGFCSSLVLEIPTVGDVLHLGLTCASPKARGKKLTHKLTSKLLTQYLLKEAPFDGAWVTNCACVLSSLGNVALYFEDIYPSPFGAKKPTGHHLNIAKGISKFHRAPIAINHDAKLNEQTFIFEGSVKDAVFEKSAHDSRFHHRNKEITHYYQSIMNFERGDEVLQVGKVSMLTLPKYFFKQAIRKVKRSAREFQNSPEEYVTE